jgi:cysteine desulfurase
MMAKKSKKHIIYSAFEHHAVLHCLQRLEKEGFEITLLDVHEDGIVRPNELEAAIREDTALVTIMYANNEIGTIQPIKEIGEICAKHHVLFHTDAVQAVGNLPIDVKDAKIDMLSMSSHKFHGPKGVGALYIRRGVVIPNLIDGGAQERGRRAGTENTAGIVGMGAALELAVASMKERSEKLSEIRDYIIDRALKIERSRVNGDRKNRLPGNVSLCFEGIEGESLLLMLDLKGVCASSGSACTSGSLDPSHVLLSIGLPHEVAHGSLRLSFSDENTMEDAEYILSVLPDIVDRLRTMSPLWERIKKEEKGEKY